ncbi:P-loop containing nucleoside triphosphate hydrolase protein [Mrakia frigida]|uniref:P-loop containing nucleoside triphosphate hydrolase protein n=1 Tax=Mrakia frigida TaxID=29902 RepID=UPI003FCBFC8E
MYSMVSAALVVSILFSTFVSSTTLDARVVERTTIKNYSRVDPDPVWINASTHLTFTLFQFSFSAGSPFSRAISAIAYLRTQQLQLRRKQGRASSRPPPEEEHASRLRRFPCHLLQKQPSQARAPPTECLVSQEATLFTTTVRANVELGLIGTLFEDSLPEEKFKLVQEACIKANAHDFVSKLPRGYDTIVGERGMLLSGGQKQGCHRSAIVSNPRILLLNESTSALDSTSEKVVQAALDKAAKGRTTIAIAHRLSTIQNADRRRSIG